MRKYGICITLFYRLLIDQFKLEENRLKTSEPQASGVLTLASILDLSGRFLH